MRRGNDVVGRTIKKNNLLTSTRCNIEDKCNNQQCMVLLLQKFIRVNSTNTNTLPSCRATLPIIVIIRSELEARLKLLASCLLLFVRCL